MGDKIIISVTPSVFQVDDSFNDMRFMKVRIAAMHSGKNLNGSSFSTEVIRNAQDTFKNIAILANVIWRYDEDGNVVADYGGHDAHIQPDKFNPKDNKVVYEQKVVGIVPETNNFEIIHDDEHDWDVVNVDALIYRDYGNYVCDILSMKGGKTDVSAEIYCPDVSYDVDSGVVNVNKMIMSGITLLGSDKQPAMTGAKATVFSTMNEQDKNREMLQIIQELKESLDNYITNNGKQYSQEGGKGQLKFQELLAKYNVTKEDITFDVDGLSDDELEAKFAEAFGQSNDEESNKNVIKCSIDGNEFSLNTDDIYYSVSKLINATYCDADAVDYYFCEVYPDEKYVIFYSFSNNAHTGYRQSYSVNNDVFELVGERVPVHNTWLTDDQENSINEMKSNYPVISEKLGRYEDEPKKVEILNSDCYSSIADDEDFKKLCDDHFDMSIAEVSAKADEILLRNAKANKFSYSDANASSAVKPLPRTIKRDFGKLFEDFNV